jgi:hypothetical protein
MAEQSATVAFTLEKPGHGIWLLVEARNIESPSRAWAGEYLRRLFAYALIPPSEYFLLALRNHMYLWKHPTENSGEPDFEGSTAAALQAYLSRLSYPLEKLSKSSFEFLIQAWLGDLVAGDLPPSDGSQAWLEDSGLADSVRDASIHTNLAA